MLNNKVLEIFIGLVFTYTLYSLFATIINEIIASLFRLRAKMLERAIKRMLTDDASNSTLKSALFDKFFKHPLIKYMNNGRKFSRVPSYLSSTNFSKALFDILMDADTTNAGGLFHQIKGGIDSLAPKNTDQNCSSDTMTLLRSFAKDANGDIDTFSEKCGRLFNTCFNTCMRTAACNNGFCYSKFSAA